SLAIAHGKGRATLLSRLADGFAAIRVGGNSPDFASTAHARLETDLDFVVLRADGETHLLCGAMHPALSKRATGKRQIPKPLGPSPGHNHAARKMEQRIRRRHHHRSYHGA